MKNVRSEIEQKKNKNKNIIKLKIIITTTKKSGNLERKLVNSELDTNPPT